LPVGAGRKPAATFNEKSMKLLARVRLETKRAEFGNVFHVNHYFDSMPPQTAELANQAQLHQSGQA